MKHLLNYKPFLMIREAQESAQTATQSATQSQINVQSQGQAQKSQGQGQVEIPKTKKITKSPKYKKPEFEFKEFYRAFKNNESLQNILPKEIDREIFKVEGSGFDGEPEWLSLHLDPPSKQKNEDGEEVQLIGTEDFIEVAKNKDERFVPFIELTEKLFNGGEMETLKLNFIIENLDNFKSHDWDEIKKNPDYLDQCEEEYKKALESGLDDVSLNQKGLVQKYPDIEINKAQAWSGYFKDSINYFNSVAESGGELPCTQFIVHDNIYYTIGGRRRMFWHFYNKLNPKVWLIKIGVVSSQSENPLKRVEESS